jgi:hypothetical protein
VVTGMFYCDLLGTGICCCELLGHGSFTVNCR